MTAKTSGEIHLSVVVPAYNEEKRIGPTLDRIRAYLARQPWPGEIVVVDDGSMDRTAARAEDALRGMPEARVLSRSANRGKGASVKEGVLAARGAFVLFTDADLSTPIEELDKFWPLMEAGCDIAIGSRALPGSNILVRQNPVREAMGKAFNLLVRLFLFRGIPDTQCGFKLFRRTAARNLFSRLRTPGFGCDVEILDLARRSGLRIGQVPVVWRHSRPSRVRLVRGAAGMLADLLRIKLRRGLGRKHL